MTKTYTVEMLSPIGVKRATESLTREAANFMMTSMNPGWAGWMFNETRALVASRPLSPRRTKNVGPVAWTGL